MKTLVLGLGLGLGLGLVPVQKYYGGWSFRPERTGIHGIHELACGHPCCNARQPSTGVDGDPGVPSCCRGQTTEVRSALHAPGLLFLAEPDKSHS